MLLGPIFTLSGIGTGLPTGSFILDFVADGPNTFNFDLKSQ